MVNQVIACCGLDCESCDARIATLKNDDELREKTARKWSILNHVEITAADIHCTGCRLEGVKTPFCSDLCGIRKCVQEKGFDTCGDCKELDHCPLVAPIHQYTPGAKENLLK